MAGSGYFGFAKGRIRCKYNGITLIKSNHVVGAGERHLEKYPNQRSMHSCGILISKNPYSTRLWYYERVSIVLFDMHIARILVLKFDILSQRGIESVSMSSWLKKIRIKIDINTAISKKWGEALF
jgi:DNA polymerase-3 subunit alpha/error-prone DNA polymerase